VVIVCRTKISFLTWVLCLFLFTPLLYAASLTSELDRVDTEEGQSVTLTITAKEVDGNLSFEALKSDFEIVDTRRSKNLQFINGKSDASVTWQLSLIPLHAGSITIASFTLGGVKSAAIVLNVSEATGNTQGPAGKEFFLDMSVDNKTPYVQEQVVLTTKIYQARNIVEGSLSEPEAEAIVQQRLGQDKGYNVNLNGKKYHVIERRYAIFAQKSGELKIPPLKLLAKVEKQNSWNSSSFFTPTQTIRLQSNAIALQVKPKLASANAGWWLPAAALTLEESWSDDLTQVSVDEPITRTIELSAEGVSSNQLPSINPPVLKNAKIYSDQALLTSDSNESTLFSRRVDKWAIIPRKEGPLRLPELKVQWFDTQSQRLKSAVLAARVINVLPSKINSLKSDVSTSGQTVPSKKAMPVGVDAKDPQSHVAQANDLQASRSYTSDKWFWIGLVAVFGWVLTALAWWWSKKLERGLQVSEKLKPAKIHFVASLKAVDVAIEAKKPEELAHALLAWAAMQWPEKTPTNLNQLAQKLNSSELHLCFKQLDESLYSSHSNKEQWNYSQISEQIKQALKQLKKQATRSKSVLENL
jgi:hypothetical protein